MGKIKIHKGKHIFKIQLKDDILRSLFGKEPDDPMIFRVALGYRAHDLFCVSELLDDMIDNFDNYVNYKIYGEDTLITQLASFNKPKCCEYVNGRRFWGLSNLYFKPNNKKIISDGNGRNIIHYCGGNDFIYIAVAGAGWVIVVDENVEI